MFLTVTCVSYYYFLGNIETKVFVFVLKMDNNFCLNFAVAFAYVCTIIEKCSMLMSSY